jgi:hypothetical protein
LLPDSSYVYEWWVQDLQKAILEEKARGTSDLEIGQKYGVTFRYIERLITKSQGVNVSSLKVSKKVKSIYPKDFKEERTTVWSLSKEGIGQLIVENIEEIGRLIFREM